MTRAKFNLGMAWVTLLTCGAIVPMLFLDPGLAALLAVITLPCILASWIIGSGA
jgi:hypothetical protein